MKNLDQIIKHTLNEHNLSELSLTTSRANEENKNKINKFLMNNKGVNFQCTFINSSGNVLKGLTVQEFIEHLQACGYNGKMRKPALLKDSYLLVFEQELGFWAKLGARSALGENKIK